MQLDVDTRVKIKNIVVELFLQINVIKNDNKKVIIQVILQRTVVNNLGQDCLMGPKTLDRNYCRQPTLCLLDLCLKVLTVQSVELRLFLGQGIHLTHTTNVALLT